MAHCPGFYVNAYSFKQDPPKELVHMVITPKPCVLYVCAQLKAWCLSSDAMQLFSRLNNNEV